MNLDSNGSRPEWVPDLKTHIEEQFSQAIGLISGFSQRLMRQETRCIASTYSSIRKYWETLEEALFCRRENQRLHRSVQFAPQDRARQYRAAESARLAADPPQRQERFGTGAFGR